MTAGDAMDFFLGVLQSLIGAFFGFFLASVLQKSQEDKQKEEAFKKIKSAIDDELLDIFLNIKDIIKNGEYPGKIQTPIWDASIYSALCLELVQSDKYYTYLDIYLLIKQSNDYVEHESYYDASLTIKKVSEKIKELNIEDIKNKI